MRKIYLILAVLFASTAFGQTSLSFYHLGDATFQNSTLNPAYSPDARIFFGLPVLSGIHIHANNKFSYNQAIKKEAGNNVVSVTSLLGDLQNNNLSSVNANIDLFHIGYNMPNGPGFTFAVRERLESDVLYPKELLEFVWQGNGNKLGETIDIGKMGISMTHFREWALGMSYQVDKQLSVGARLKYFQGFSNVSTPSNLKATLEVDPQTYAWDVNTENFVLRTAGLNSYNASYLVSPGNSGFGMDIGFEYRVNRYLGFAGSILDLGKISWKTDIENRQFNDTTFNYAGINIKGADDIGQSLQDSLFSKFKTVKNADAYSTWLPVKAYGTLIWRYTDQTQFLGTVGARMIQGQMKMLYGGGVRQKIGPLTVSANALKMPQHFFNIGAALAVRGGPVQYYIAADQVINFSVPDAKALDFRTGMNFMIGRKAGPGLGSRGAVTTFGSDKTKQGQNKGINTGSFLGSKVKTKRREGIYSIIKKQKRREVPKSATPPKNQKNPNVRSQ